MIARPLSSIDLVGFSRPAPFGAAAGPFCNSRKTPELQPKSWPAYASADKSTAPHLASAEAMPPFAGTSVILMRLITRPQGSGLDRMKHVVTGDVMP